MRKKDQQIVAQKPAPPTVQRPQPARKPGNQVPIHSPSGPMQLTPIIQPIAFVPYTTQEQPLYMYDDVATEGEYEDDYSYSEADYADETKLVDASQNTKVKKVSGAAIALIILSIVMIAVYVIGKFFAFTYIQIANDTSGLDMLLNVISGGAIVFDTITVVALAISVSVVAAVLILVSSIIRIKTKGACVFAKIFSFVGLVTALVAVMISMVQKEDVAINYGMYVVAGIALLLVMIAFLSKNKK